MGIYLGDKVLTDGAEVSAEELNKKVSKAGDTMTGLLEINKSGDHISAKDTNLDVDTTPSATVHGGYYSIRDKNNNLVGRVYSANTNTGHNVTALQAWAGTTASTSASLGIKIKHDGTGAVGYSPTPPINSNSTDIATTAWVRSILPAGIVFPAPVATLNGFLLCNGQAVSRTTYAALFAAIGTNFGAGNGSTTFNVPDYRGCFLRGLGGSSAANMYTKQPMGAPDISGNIPVTAAAYRDLQPNGAFARTATYGAGDDHTGGGSTANQINFSAARSNSAYGAANEIRPVNFAINFFIKY